MIGLNFLLNVKIRKEEGMKTKKSKMLTETSLLFMALFLMGFGPTILHAAGSGYPDKAITLVIPSTPGGITDLTGRLWSEALEKYLKQPVVVVNKPGGGMTIGGYAVASAKPDGYTIGLLPGSASLTELFTYFQTAPYSSNDLKPIFGASAVVLTIAVKGDAPWNNLRELIEFARNNPGMKYGHHGRSTTGYLVMTTIARTEKVNFVHVPILNDTEIIPAILGGHFPIGTPGLPAVASLFEAKRLKLLALCIERRSVLASDVPPIVELGYKLPSAPFLGIFGPKGTPDEVVKKLGEVAHKISEDKDFQNKAKNMSIQLDYKDTASFEKYILGYKEGIKTFFKEEGLVK
jgi:tripartite-type tricarboxylate transporter receptor subunit TctC